MRRRPRVEPAVSACEPENPAFYLLDFRPTKDMMQNDHTEQLLTEILEVQRAHLDEYKRVTSESLQLQRRAADAQVGYIRLLRPMLIVGSVVIAGLIVYVLWLSRLIR
jgi:hypothetical protein